MMTRPSDTIATVTMYDRTITVDYYSPPAQHHLARVIRGNGPREGQLMGWAVLEFDSGGPAEGFTFHWATSRHKAQRQLRSLTGGAS